jgi:type VI secretion system protein ImpJ
MEPRSTIWSTSSSMNHLSKVVWFEGMYLGPHHFQAQRRSFEDLIHFASSNLWFEPCGFSGCGLDPDALRNRTVALTHARGIFQDGLVFSMPESDSPPAARPIGDFFPPTREALKVMLAVPPLRQNNRNCAFTAEEIRTTVRYFAEPKSLCDENTGADPRFVHLGRKNIRFAFEGEEVEGECTLPIGRVLRDGSGNFIYDPKFIPPCIQISASERLMMMLNRLLEVLDEKSAGVSLSRRGVAKFQAAFSSSELATFWFAHTINSSLTVLRHLYQAEHGHPEQVYAELTRLGGALCTFGMNSNPQSLPAYDHFNLDQCFHALDAHIRTHLELVVPTNCITIPLQPTGRYTYEGAILDHRCLGRARWILAVHSNIGEADLISRTQRQLKISSAELLPELVKVSLPGLSLTHLPLPPSAVAPKVDFQYFGVSRTGSTWENIMQTRTIGLYVPGEVPNPEVELLVVLES